MAWDLRAEREGRAAAARGVAWNRAGERWPRSVRATGLQRRAVVQERSGTVSDIRSLAIPGALSDACLLSTHFLAVEVIIIEVAGLAVGAIE
jgi:hypothetical protein